MSIPPTKTPLFDPKLDPPFVKNLHHHHLGPDFSSETRPSSHFNYDQYSPSLPYFSSHISRPMRPPPLESSSYQETSYQPIHPENMRPPINYEYPPPYYSNQSYLSNPPPYYSNQNYISPPITYASGPSFLPPPPFQFEERPPLYEGMPPQRERPPIYEGMPPQRLAYEEFGRSNLEYVPFQRKVIEHVPVEKIEYMPVEHTETDYYAVERQMEYRPVTKYESRIDYVPRQVVDHIPQTYVEYVPVRRQEMVPREKLQEKVEYMPVDKSVVHYPHMEKQFAYEAEKSGRIRNDLSGIYYPAQVVENKKQVNFGKNNMGVSASYFYGTENDKLNKSMDLSSTNFNFQPYPNYYGNNQQVQPNYYGNNPNVYGYNNNQYPTPQPNGYYNYGNYNGQTNNGVKPPNFSFADNNYQNGNNFNNNNVQNFTNNNNNFPAYAKNVEKSKFERYSGPEKDRARNRSDLENLKKELENGRDTVK